MTEAMPPDRLSDQLSILANAVRGELDDTRAFVLNGAQAVLYIAKLNDLAAAARRLERLVEPAAAENVMRLPCRPRLVRPSGGGDAA